MTYLFFQKKMIFLQIKFYLFIKHYYYEKVIY